MDLTQDAGRSGNGRRAGRQHGRADGGLPRSDGAEPPSPASATSVDSEELVSDDEIDRMIQADVLASEKPELGKLDELESEIAKELGATKQKD